MFKSLNIGLKIILIFSNHQRMCGMHGIITYMQVLKLENRKVVLKRGENGWLQYLWL